MKVLEEGGTPVKRPGDSRIKSEVKKEETEGLIGKTGKTVDRGEIEDTQGWKERV